MKKLLSVGKYIQTVINYGLKLQKGMQTFNALMKHLQAFEAERKEIWGVKEAPKVESKTAS